MLSKVTFDLLVQFISLFFLLVKLILADGFHRVDLVILFHHIDLGKWTDSNYIKNLEIFKLQLLFVGMMTADWGVVFVF